MPILHDTLGEPDIQDLPPGSHVILLTHNPSGTIGARKLGLEVRDCILVVSPHGNRFAFLLRKELEGTVAENVLRYGTGALNIDGCRVATTDNLNGGAYSGVYREKTTEWQNSDRSEGKGSGFRQGLGQYHQPTGRWPTNLVFLHGPGCRKTGTRKVRADGHFPARRGHGGVGTTGHRGQDNLTETHDDGVMTAYECEPGCPVAELDRQSGTLTSGTGAVRTKPYGGYSGGDGVTGQPEVSYGDSGGASRFFPQFESENLLIEWLKRLIGVNS